LSKYLSLFLALIVNIYKLLTIGTERAITAICRIALKF